MFMFIMVLVLHLYHEQSSAYLINDVLRASWFNARKTGRTRNNNSYLGPKLHQIAAYIATCTVDPVDHIFTTVFNG